MRDIIKIYNTVSKDKINNLTANSLVDGELALVREDNYERLYCKNTNGEITPIHRTMNGGEIKLPTIQKEWIDPGLATWTGDTAAMNQVKFNTRTTTVPMVFDSDRLTNMTDMFYGCSVLTEIPLIDTSNVTNMSYMFSTCSGLTEIPLLNTSKVTNMNYMFQNCSVLTEIPLLDTSNVTDMNQMFYNCEKLVTCKLKGIKVDLDLKDSPLLNVESIRYIMNNSQIVTNQTLTINSTAWRNSGLTDTSPDVVAFKAKGWGLVH